MRLLIAVLLFAATSVAHANLINLTPGGWNMANGLPPGFERTIHETFFDEATPEGWTSQYGHINGGVYFFTDLAAIHAGATSLPVSWHFHGQPEGYFLSTIALSGISLNGDVWMSIYAVPLGERFDSLDQFVTIDGTVTISGIAFFGKNSIPDSGSTAALFGLGVFGLLVVRRFRGRATA